MNSAIISISKNSTLRTRGTRAVSTRELRSFTIIARHPAEGAKMGSNITRAVAD